VTCHPDTGFNSRKEGVRSARHVTGQHSNQRMRVENAMDNVASAIHLPLPPKSNTGSQSQTRR